MQCRLGLHAYPTMTISANTLQRHAYTDAEPPAAFVASGLPTRHFPAFTLFDGTTVYIGHGHHGSASNMGLLGCDANGYSRTRRQEYTFRRYFKEKPGSMLDCLTQLQLPLLCACTQLGLLYILAGHLGIFVI